MALASVDVTKLLHEAIEGARAAGLAGAADELEARTSAAFTTSSEYLGEVGLGIRRFLARERGRVPVAVERQLKDCLAEVRRVWPRLV